MAKRFIDTEIWDKEKFCSSSDKQKLLTLFITSKCDQIGVFKMANMLITAYIGSPVTKEDILSIPVDIIELSEGKYWLVNFCKFQYGELKETCKPHKKYIEMLKSEGLFERVSKGYPKGIHTLQEKEKEKEEEKEKEKDKKKETKKFDLPDWISKDSWDGFVEMRKKIKKPLTDRACIGIINKLDKFGKQNADAILDQSTENCWQTVYELKEQQPQQDENPWGLL